MADFEFSGDRNFKISTGPNGQLSIDSIDAFREIAAEGNRQLFYAYSEAHGSAYGKVGKGYHAPASVGCVLARTTLNPPHPAQNGA